MTCELRHRSAKSERSDRLSPVPATPFAPAFRGLGKHARLHDPRCLARRSLAHNFQAVWYRAAIMALCWPATPSEVKFAADSLLEGAGFEPSVPPQKEVGCRSPI